MNMTAPVLLCTITCPECGHAREEEMTTDACTYLYKCTRIIVDTNEGI